MVLCFLSNWGKDAGGIKIAQSQVGLVQKKS
jgi:hypothetical protein